MSFIKESKNAYKQVQENHIAIAMGKMLDDEGSMILNQLEELERAIKMIRDYVGTDYEKQLPAWVQSKVTLGSDYISTVGNYLSSKNEKVTEQAIKEEVDLEETSLTSIHKMKEDGKTAEEIAKELKLNAGLVKKILGEEVELKEFTDVMLAALKKEYDPLKGKTITTSQYQQLKNILLKLQDGDLEKLQKQNIPFASTGAGSILRVRKSPVKITNIKVPGLEGMAEEIKVDKPAIIKSLQDRLKKLQSDPDHGGKKDMIAYVQSKIKMIQSKKEEKQIAEANEEKLSDQAKKQGLEYYGFGRYGKDKTVTHKSVNGNLQALPKDQQTKADDKESKPEKVDTVTDLKNTADQVGFDDLNINDDEKNIYFTREFDPTLYDEDDVKDEYNNIVKMLNKKGIKYKPNFDQDVEIDNDQEYMQINFSVKKEEVKLTENNSEDLYKKLGWNLNNKTYGATLTHSKHGVIEVDRYGEWHHKPKNINSISTVAYKPLAFGKNNDLSKYISSLKEETELKPVPSLEDSAKKHNVDIEALKKQLEKGVKVESEHTDDIKVAEKIALAHLDERPDYYEQIDKLEKKPVEKVEEVKEPTGDLKDACWTGYVAIGTKMKNGKRVPNCVPKSEAYKGAKAVVENAFKKLKEKK